MADYPSLLVFGPLGIWPSTGEFDYLRRELLEHDHLSAIREAILDLPEFWRTLSARDAALSPVYGLAAAKQLVNWLTTGEGPSRGFTKNNILSLPLTIIRHLCDYLTYLRQNGTSHSTLITNTAQAGGIQGLCVGLLSAAAVQSSNDGKTIGLHGVLSLYLSFAIGAYVDLDAVLNGQTSCLAIRWKASSSSITTIESILKKHESAYISVIRSESEATITVPSFSIAEIARHLSSQDVSVLDTGLTGRYHTQSYAGVPERILQACTQHTNIRFGEENDSASEQGDEELSHPDKILSIARGILLEVSNWQQILSETISRLPVAQDDSFILTIGSDAVKSALPRNIPVVGVSKGHSPAAAPKTTEILEEYPENAIAVVGMSCKLPGADSLDEFWQLLTSGTAMVKQVPTDRWPESVSTRKNGDKHKFWGNFMSNVDNFDHKFFKKSSREAASMDPQQRLLLQGAYQAMESAGYFSPTSSSRNRDVGCYIGLCAVDYDANIASHPPNAFSTLGSLRAFLSGKLSHFFGWSGPSLTFDTACSSSAVAIHTACRALQANECTQALAGGVALFTSPYLYENLAAAHFLSPTGATKPFDAKADGYCRGEGLGLVVLKRLSTAVADKDNILAVIGGSAINQNDSCVPITVPYASSQETLYQNAARQANILPHQVSFVEAHGTGTPVGDPIEMESIRRVFGGSHRRTPLAVSSVKGNIGHLEGASGVAALIKAILQIEHRTAVIQASFESLNPKIPPLGPDRIIIPTSNIPLPDSFLTACINNYGAAGSNCTLMVMQPPRNSARVKPSSAVFKYPIIVAANSEASVTEYCRTLGDYVQRTTDKENLLGSIAFSLAKRQNEKHLYAFFSTVSSTKDLEVELTRQVKQSTSLIHQRPTGSKAILAFGGQTRDYVGLSRQAWEQLAVLRSHLDRCDEVLRSLDYPGLYPAIFQTEPIQDIRTLHSGIFALQYASARAWIDCGLDVDAVIGHSLGQLTALTVSGILSLEDGIKFVAGRASLMKDYWGSERGSMILVDADFDTLSSIQHSLEIACYNGPSSHVLVGEKASVDEFGESLLQRGTNFKRLQVTNGFHSKFTEPLIEPLKNLASTLHFNKPTIPIETCSDGSSWPEATGDLLAEHTRKPVFFTQAVQRLASSRGSCTWLEVGSDSGVTSMARRALGNSNTSHHEFLSCSLSKVSAIDSLTDITIQLWKRGHSVNFWPFHSSEAESYQKLRLPPYQFEKNKHWLDLLPPHPAVVEVSTTTQLSEPEIPQLVKLIKSDADESLFHINSRCHEYQHYVSGHVVAGSPLCPATVYMEIVARACKLLVAWEPEPLLGFQNMRIDSPLGMGADRDIAMTLRPHSQDSWRYSFSSRPKSAKESSEVSHAVGIVQIRRDARVVGEEFGAYERLTGEEQIRSLYEDAESEQVRGPLLYKLFSRVVDYSALYQGLKSIAVKNSRIAGTVVSQPEPNNDTVLTQPSIIDSWMQIAGFHANSFYPSSVEDVFVFTKVDRMQFGPHFTKPSSSAPTSWKIYSNLTPIESNELSNDIFVFDTVSGRLVVLILGARFNKVRLSSLTKVLSRLNNSPEDVAILVGKAPQSNPQPSITVNKSYPAVPEPLKEPTKPRQRTEDASYSVFNDVCFIFEKVAEVPRSNVKGNMTTDDLGIDSLMMMEVISELSSHFSVHLPVTDLEHLTDVDSLVSYLLSRGCGSNGNLFESVGTSIATTGSDYSSGKTPGSPNTAVTFAIAESSTDKRGEQLAKLLQEHLELSTLPGFDDNLADMGLDSLLAIELGSDIEKMFGVTIDLYQLDERSSFGDLARLAGIDTALPSETSGYVDVVLDEGSFKAAAQSSSLEVKSTKTNEPFHSSSTSLALGQAHSVGTLNVHEAFSQTRFDFDKFSLQEGFTNFWSAVYPTQERLVLSYVGDAFRKLGGDIASIPAGETLPKLSVLTKHEHLLERMHKILADGGYIDGQKSQGYRRTSKSFDLDRPQVMLEKIIAQFPLHASEHRLLNVTGSQLAECLTGKADPLALLFANRTNRKLLADVYDLSPMCRAATRLLASFIEKAFPPSNSGEVFHFLEVGGGTGGTTKFLVEYLTRCGIKFTYTFTDISSALVGGMKKTMQGYDCMRYATLDVEQVVQPDFVSKFHALISTNCIHATGNATSALANLRNMLRPDGVLALVEFTNGLYWFDLVYGLLDGWWLFSDGRQHALADVSFWERSILAAGYKSASWSDGDTRESRTLQLICAFNSAAADTYKEDGLAKRAGVTFETVTWKKVNGLDLNADIYYPPANEGELHATKRPVALLLHGGGHVLFTRKDIHMKHIKTLLNKGFLPISFDYRLCPEVTLAEGPMTDARDALEWVRSSLPKLQLARRDIQPDASRIAAVGWSAGGHLAMTLGYTAQAKGLKAPEVILAFYCPSNFEAEWWKSPIYPKAVKESPNEDYDLLEGVSDRPIAGYKPNTTLGAPMSLKDPRWRIIIHYNWKAQLVPLLVSGLPTKAQADETSEGANNSRWKALAMPSTKDIQAVSPYAQILQGSYHTPTFIVHGDQDDLIPWQQSRDTIEALVSQGVSAGFAAPQDAGHAFDLWADEDPRGTGWISVDKGYDFVSLHIF